MTNPSEALARLRALNEARTKGEWSRRKERITSGAIVAGPVIELPKGSTQCQVALTLHADFMESSEEREANTNAIVAAMNALGPLLDAAAEAAFLIERLTEFGNDGDTKTDDGERDWHGHIDPPLSRLSAALDALAKLEGSND